MSRLILLKRRKSKKCLKCKQKLSKPNQKLKLSLKDKLKYKTTSMPL